MRRIFGKMYKGGSMRRKIMANLALAHAGQNPKIRLRHPPGRKASGAHLRLQQTVIARA